MAQINKIVIHFCAGSVSCVCLPTFEYLYISSMHLTSSPLGFVCVFHLYAGASVAVAVVEHSQRWLVSRRQFSNTCQDTPTMLVSRRQFSNTCQDTPTTKTPTLFSLNK